MRAARRGVRAAGAALAVAAGVGMGARGAAAQPDAPAGEVRLEGACGRWGPPEVPNAEGPPARPPARSAGRGYLGLRLSEWSAAWWTPAGRLVRYCAYPAVVSVEPASPAERGGVGAGDTLIAFGRHDLVRGGPVPLDRLLVPGATVRLRLRRGGRARTSAVVVAERPPDVVWDDGGAAAGAVGWRVLGGPDGRWPTFGRGRSPGAWGRATARGEAPDGVPDAMPNDRAGAPPGDRERRVRVRVLPPPARPAGGPAAAPGDLLVDAFGDGVGPPGGLAGRVGDAPWVAYLRALPPLVAGPGAAAGPAALAGARVIALDADLRDAVAAAPARGLFVLQVLPGTPAADAGLRAGDVIVGAGGRAVDAPAGLQRALRAAGRARAVGLRVARGGAERDVVLRW